MKVRFTNGVDDETKGFVDLDDVLKDVCFCPSPEIMTDEDGINYCVKCKIEVELLKKP